MAQLKVNDLDGLMLTMQEIAQIPDDVQAEILNAQADIVVDAQKQSALAAGVSPHGEMMDSIGKTKIKTGNAGKSIYVYPQGINSSGTRNAEVAFIREYGAKKRNQPGKMFIRNANEKSAEATTKAAAEIYDAWLKTKGL